MGTKRKSTTDYTREVSNKIISSNNQKNSNVEVHSRLLSSENSFVAYHHYHPLPQQQQQQQQQQLEGDCAVTTGTGSTGSSANARERARMRVISHAFVRLKTTLPWVPADTKLSKLDTLRLATSYIAHLRHVLNADQSGCSSDVTTIPAVKHTTSPPAINPMTLTWPYSFRHNSDYRVGPRLAKFSSTSPAMTSSSPVNNYLGDRHSQFLST